MGTNGKAMNQAFLRKGNASGDCLPVSRGSKEAELLAGVIDALEKECDMKPPRETVERFLSGGEWRHYESLEDITSAGEVDTNCYVVGSGIIRYAYFNGDREVTPCFGTPGTMFLSYHSYLFRQGSYYEVQACCPADLFVIPEKHFDRLIEESHPFTQWLLRMAYTQLWLFDMKNSVINGTASERYASLVNRRPEIVENVPLKIIASYLGITPQYLSVLRRKYR